MKLMKFGWRFESWNRRVDGLLTWIDEVRFEVERRDESKEFEVLMKDFDTFLFLKMSSTFLSSSFSERRLILFFKQVIFLLISSNFLKLESIKVKGANEGSSDELRWSLDEDVDLEARFEGEEEE